MAWKTKKKKNDKNKKFVINSMEHEDFISYSWSFASYP